MLSSSTASLSAEQRISPNGLVSIYLDNERPLPTDLLLIVLEYSGLVGLGQRSLHFWVYFTRPISARRARRFDRRSSNLRR